MKLSSSSYWIRSGIYSFGSRFSTLIFGFGSFYFLVRYFDKGDFGLWSLFLTTTTIVEMSRNGLIQNALIKLLHNSLPENEGKVVAASWIINLIFSILTYFLLLGVGAAFGALMEAPIIFSMFAWYGLTMLVLVPLSEFNYLQQAKFSFAGIFWTAFVRQGLLFSSVIFLYLSDIVVSPTELVIIHLLCTVAGLIIAFILSRPYARYSLSYDKESVVQAFQFGRHVMGTNVSSLLFKSTDQLAIGALLNPLAVASYNAAIRLSNLIEYPATSVAEILYPKSTSRMKEEGEQVGKVLYEKSVGLVLAITLPVVIVVWIFADPIILLLAGEKYQESAAILRVTILFGVFTPFNRQFGTIMDSSGRPQYNFRVVFASFLINVVLNLVFINLWGIMGAAYATLLSYIIMYAISHIVLRRFFDVKMIKVMTHMLSFYKMIFDRIRSFRTSRSNVS